MSCTVHSPQFITGHPKFLSAPKLHRSPARRLSAPPVPHTPRSVGCGPWWVNVYDVYIIFFCTYVYIYICVCVIYLHLYEFVYIYILYYIIYNVCVMYYQLNKTKKKTLPCFCHLDPLTRKLKYYVLWRPVSVHLIGYTRLDMYILSGSSLHHRKCPTCFQLRVRIST